MAKQLSIAQYAKLIGITRQGVLWRIYHGKDLPGVYKIDKVGKAYVLTMNE